MKKKLVENLNKRREIINGKHQDQLRKLSKAHEEWKVKFDTEHKKKLQKCLDYHERKITKVELNTNELQVYTIFQTKVESYQEKVKQEVCEHKLNLEAFEKEVESTYYEIHQIA